MVLPYQLRIPVYHDAGERAKLNCPMVHFRPDWKSPGDIALIWDNVETGHFDNDECEKHPDARSKSVLKQRRNLGRSFWKQRKLYLLLDRARVPADVHCRAGQMEHEPGNSLSHLYNITLFRSLEAAMEVTAKVWIGESKVGDEQAIPAILTLPETAATESTGIRRYPKAHTYAGIHLHRTVTAAPSDISEASSYLHFRTFRPRASASRSYLEPPEISSQPTGYFFALPGDKIVTFGSLPGIGFDRPRS